MFIICINSYLTSKGEWCSHKKESDCKEKYAWGFSYKEVEVAPGWYYIGRLQVKDRIDLEDRVWIKKSDVV